MSKEYIPLFLDFNETTEDLTDEECGRLVRAIVDYACGGEPDNLQTSGEKVAFKFLKGLVDRNAAISDARARAGASKANKTEQTKTNENKTEQTETNENKIPNQNQKQIPKTKNKNQNQEQDIRFAQFWAVYPRKVAKPDARKKFDRLNPDDNLLAVMIRAVERQKQSEQWTKDGGQYIPHPATWIHQRRWEDEEPVKPVRVLPAQDFPQRNYDDANQDLMASLARDMAEFKKGAG